MGSYRGLAPFYRELVGQPEVRARRVRRRIGQYTPGARSLLELGCGTGAVLAELGGTLSLAGLDLSPDMLAVARGAVPGARFFEADMADFSLGEEFDVVVCVFDGLNHLLAAADWAAAFDCVSRHLAVGGLFIFDVSPIGRLARSAGKPAQVVDFAGNTLIIEGTALPENRWAWDIRVFERRAGDSFRLSRERITKLGLELDRIEKIAADRFELLELRDGQGQPPTDDSEQAYFVVRRPG